jgi:hypothetical protein
VSCPYQGKRTTSASTGASDSSARGRPWTPPLKAEEPDGAVYPFTRTVGLARARTKIELANLVYNVKRLIFWER